MADGSRTREMVEQVVRQEIEEMASESTAMVRELVREQLVHRLRAAVRDAISRVVDEMLSDEAAKQVHPAQPTLQEERAQEEAGIPATSPDVELTGKEAPASGAGDGRYVYCIADSGLAVSLGEIGIGDNEVYSIPHEALCAVVHNCPAEPYSSADEELVRDWVRIHQKVLDAAMEKFGSVLPLAFDTIIRSEDKKHSERIVKDWLRDNSESLGQKLDKVRGKQEFGVQILYDPRVLGELIAGENEQIQRLKGEMAGQKPGMAYMYRQKLEKAVKEEMAKMAERTFKDFYGAIKNHVDDTRVEKTKKEKDKTMLMNLSCLVVKAKANELGDELERIDNREGFSVRFTGPWAPHSFV